MKPTDFSHYSSFVVQFNKYSFDDNGYFAVYDKDCRKFELHQRMRSAEYQRQSRLNFS